MATGTWQLGIYWASGTLYYGIEKLRPKECVGALGKHASQKAEVEVIENLRSLGLRLLSMTDYVRAGIFHNGVEIFGGIIRREWDFDAQFSSIDSLSLTIEDQSALLARQCYADGTTSDDGTTLLTPAIWEDLKICDPSDTDNSIVHKLFALTSVDPEITVLSGAVISTTKDYFQIFEGDDVKACIEELLWENDLDYRFTAYGEVEIFSTSISRTSTATISTFLDSLKVSGSVWEQKGYKMSWRQYKTSGRIKLGSNTHYFSHWYPSWDMAHVAANIPYQYSQMDQDGFDLISISNKTYTVDSNDAEAHGLTVTYASDNKSCNIDYHATTFAFSGLFASERRITVNIWGNVVYSSNSEARTYVSEAGIETETLSLSYIRSQSDAEEITRRVAQRGKAGATTYSFSSYDDYDINGIYTLNESTILQMDVNVRILEKTYDPEEKIYSYVAEGAEIPDVSIAIKEIEEEEDDDEEEPLTIGFADYIVPSGDEEPAAYANGSVFANSGYTIAWSLNGTALSGTDRHITVDRSSMVDGANYITAVVTLDGTTYTATARFYYDSSYMQPLIEYAWGNSRNTAPTGGWASTPPTYSPSLPYEWMRTSTDEGSTWAYSCITGYTGGDGADAIVFDFAFSSATFVQNRRSNGSQTIAFVSDIQGLGDISPSWTCYVDGTEDSSLFDDADSPSYITIPYRNSFSSIAVMMTYGNYSVTRKLSAIDETGDAIYYGELSALPTGGVYIAGDYFVAADDFTGSDSNSYTAGYPYYYDGSSWNHELDIADSDNMKKALNVFGGVLNSGIAADSNSTTWTWLKNLVVQSAVIANLTSRNITVGDGDGTIGSGFRFRASEYYPSGVKRDSPIFDVYYDDTLIFKINTSTGAVYMLNAQIAGNSEVQGKITSSALETVLSGSGTVRPAITMTAVSGKYLVSYIWATVGTTTDADAYNNGYYYKDEALYTAWYLTIEDDVYYVKKVVNLFGRPLAEVLGTYSADDAIAPSDITYLSTGDYSFTETASQVTAITGTGYSSSIDSGSLVIVKHGTTKTYSSGNINVVSSSIAINGTTVLSVGEYATSVSCSLSFTVSSVGVYTQNIFPKENAGSTYAIGSNNAPFASLYADSIYGTVQSSSARAKKTEIEDYTSKALDIINSTKVVSFKYKADLNKERCYKHYGFIADDTAEELATPFHDVMDYGSCIGILMKAVQELSDEIKRLKGD